MTRQSQDVEFLIITPTYHRESPLVRCMKQVRSQTYGSWRLLGGKDYWWQFFFQRKKNCHQ